MGDTATESFVDSRGVLKVFSSPSTLPHLLFLVVSSGFLYVAMKIDFLGFEIQGSILFISLSISYFFAALIAPSKLGEKVFEVNDDGVGILNWNYWISSFFRLLPIVVFAAAIWVLSNYAFGEDQLNKVGIFLAMLFIAMSVFQGISLTIGWVVYTRNIQKTARKSKAGGIIPVARAGVTVILFIPLVWWFGYGADNPNNANLSTNIVWFLFLFVIAILSIILDRYTKGSRGQVGSDGVALDRVFFLIFITACWHLLGAWRRSPFTAEQTSAGMLAEEGFLMSISILLAVWSMSNKGKKRGWRIFQGQSAIFWGIGFGFVYAGSISSLTALSEGSLLTTTAIGHAITAIVMMFILPASISWVGNPDSVKESQLPVPPKNVSESLMQNNPIMLDSRVDDEDLVELLD